MADVCILIVFMSEFMDPQGAAEPEVATHNVNGRQQIFLYPPSYFGYTVLEFCFPNLHRALFCFIHHGAEGYISTGLTTRLITCALF